MYRRITIAVVVAAAALALTCLPPPLAASDSDPLRVFERYLEALRRQIGIPGLSAAIAQQERIVWETGLGDADAAAHVSARPDTLYPIASLTKTFTSVLLMQCLERGTLDLDAPIRDYSALIPEAGATVRHVLTHTSEGTPGSRFRYNGDRYVALTPVVEACTQMPFRQAVYRRVLDPLAMTDTVPGRDLENPTPTLASLFDAASLGRFASALRRQAKPYLVAGRGRATLTGYPPPGINASAGLISTVRDLASYDAALDRRLLVSDGLQQLAWTPFTSATGQLQPYGLGWFVQRYNGVKLVWHYGQWPQYSALYLKIPERELTLLLLANSADLTSRFPMAAGDVTVSSFARVFLRLFVDR